MTPDVAYVLVAAPSRIWASYSLSTSPRNWASRVARPSSDRRNALSQRVERAEVANLPDTGDRSRQRHDVVGRGARWLVDDEDPIGKRMVLGIRHCSGAATDLLGLVEAGTGSSSSAHPSDQRVAAQLIAPAIVHPAALRWPPPPNSFATAPTSTSPFDLRLTR